MAHFTDINIQSQHTPDDSIVQLNDKSGNLTLQGCIGGLSLPFLIDTGAAITAISLALWQSLPAPVKHPPHPTSTLSVRTVNGDPMIVQGSVPVPLQIGHHTFTHNALVIENLLHDVILGKDFLERFKTIIDLEHHTISLHHEFPFSKHPLPTDEPLPVNPPLCSVHALKTYVLPPNSETLVCGKLSVPVPQGTVGIIDPRAELSTRYHVCGAAELVSLSPSNTVPIRLLNPSTMPVTIYRRAQLGTFTATDKDLLAISLSNQPSGVTGTDSNVPLLGDPNITFDLSQSNLTLPQQEQLLDLLSKYQDVFAPTASHLGRTGEVQHTIDTGDAPPIRLRPYRTSPGQREEIDTQIADMLSQNIIQESVSPWAAPVVLVKKKDGTTRFCVDYRKLNEITKKDSYPLPRIDDTLDALQGSQIFSTLDLRSGYWQIELHPTAKEKSAFITHKGLYEFTVLPFGLCNSPSTFQRLMEHVLRGLNWKTCLIYIDDIIIYSRSFEEHLQHLEDVFLRLRQANVKLKPSKCFFARNSVEYLGHVVSKDGIQPNPDKIRAVTGFPVPKNTKGVRSFLGLANYYRRFIKGFASIAAPLNNLLRKNVRFKWDTNCQQSFDALKQALVTAPILAFPDFTRPFDLYVDASLDGIGMTLGQTQNGKEVAIAYAGRDLTPAERNYSATEREALAVVAGIKKFQSYLYGRHFNVYTDHNALKWLMSVKDPTGRLARWSLLLQQFDFTIHHRSGKSNGNADALSRRPYSDQSINTLTTEGVQSDVIRFHQRHDAHLTDIIDYMESGILPKSNSQARAILLSNDSIYLDEDGLLYHIAYSRGSRGRESYSQLVIPAALRYEILTQGHDNVTSGHLGVHKTYDKLRKRYFWHGMYRDVEHWCKSCVDCAMRKDPKTRPKAPLLPIPVEGAFDRVAVDCLGPFPPSHSENRYIVVFSDYLTRWPEAFAVKSIEATTISRLLIDEIVARHGAPRTLLSDRGTNFLSSIVKETCRLLDIHKLNTTAYHPQTDGLVERFNGTLAQSISMYVSKDQKDWDRHIPEILFAYRVSPSDVTGESPFYLLYGREPRLPMDVNLLTPKDLSPSIVEHRKRIVQNIEHSHRIAKENIQRAQQKMKLYYDLKAKEPNYEIGDRVWVFTPKPKRGLSRKLQHRWHGPYRVIQKLSPVHFRLRTCHTNREVTTTVHANRMKPVTDPDERPILPPPQDDPSASYLPIDDLPPDSFVPDPTTEDSRPGPLSDDPSVFSAERILRKRIRNGKPQYFVKWAGYPESEGTWEPKEHLHDPRLLQDFNNRNYSCPQDPPVAEHAQ